MSGKYDFYSAKNQEKWEKIYISRKCIPELPHAEKKLQIDPEKLQKQFQEN